MVPDGFSGTARDMAIHSLLQQVSACPCTPPSIFGVPIPRMQPFFFVDEAAPKKDDLWAQFVQEETGYDETADEKRTRKRNMEEFWHLAQQMDVINQYQGVHAQAQAPQLVPGQLQSKLSPYQRYNKPRLIDDVMLVSVEIEHVPWYQRIWDFLFG